jgi:hypothetical protein
VKRTFDLLQELANIVVTETRSQTKITGLDTKRLSGARGSRCVQRTPKVFVHDLLERPPSTPGLAPELCGYILVEGKGGTHIMMLPR